MIFLFTRTIHYVISLLKSNWVEFFMLLGSKVTKALTLGRQALLNMCALWIIHKHARLWSIIGVSLLYTCRPILRHRDLSPVSHIEKESVGGIGQNSENILKDLSQKGMAGLRMSCQIRSNGSDETTKKTNTFLFLVWYTTLSKCVSGSFQKPEFIWGRNPNIHLQFSDDSRLFLTSILTSVWELEEQAVSNSDNKQCWASYSKKVVN